ncbi:MAG: diguanylate cyclase [Nitrospirota bacterium]
MKVLIIDDDEVDRLTTIRLLNGADITLHVASNLRDGVHLALTEVFDCVLIDFELGNGTAVDFLVATEPADFAIIVLTGHANEDLAIDTLRSGAQDYLGKSNLTRAILLRAMRYACERKGAVQQIAHLNAKLRVANANLEDIAQHDPLTGVLNRRGVQDRITVEAQRAHRTGGDMMALFIDCDDFKLINDIHGHSIGDQTLQAVANVLKKAVRPTDHVARVGGDEFLVLLHDIRNADAMAVAEKIEEGVRAQQISSPTGLVRISCSMGCCPVGGKDLSLDLIIHHAEKALKQSKALGKDMISTSQMKEADGKTDEEDALDLVEFLNGLKSGEKLHVIEQPIIRLSDEVIVGYELYTHGPPGEYQQAEAFLQLALATNQGVAVDMACLRAVCDHAQDIPQGGEGPLHINLFPTTLKEVGIPKVLTMLREIQKRSGRTVCLEFNERRFIGSAADFQYLTKCMASEGILLALDGVRLSRSGLEILLFLEPAFIKVDRSLIIGAHHDSGRIQMLKRLVDIAAQRNIKSVAVGIHSLGELGMVKKLGFDMGQGYYLDEKVVSNLGAQ